MPLVSGRGKPNFTIFSDFYDLLCKNILEKGRRDVAITKSLGRHERSIHT